VKRSRRLPTTPRSKVRAALRQVWLRSRERQAALKRDGYACVRCGKKQSKARGRELKVNVHHRVPINWERLLQLVYDSGLMCGPEGLETLCVECHDEGHNNPLKAAGRWILSQRAKMSGLTDEMTGSPGLVKMEI
jgi:5-methylcytosine-specific restriction endonuclease McrA